ncbi:MAG: clan AA aspartic protease, partial [Bacteroidetes bacterium]|nr:clan AA aspartic protease [Bacteroidota bacterium]
MGHVLSGIKHNGYTIGSLGQRPRCGDDDLFLKWFRHIRENILKIMIRHFIQGIAFASCAGILMMMGCATGIVTVQSTAMQEDTLSMHSMDCNSLLKSIEHLSIECTFEESAVDEKILWHAFRRAVLENHIHIDSFITVISSVSSDSSITEVTKTILAQSLEDQGEWKILDSLMRALDKRTSALALTASLAPDMTRSLSTLPDTLLIEFSSTSVPIVEVTVNGSLRRFWLDTGASEMVISSDVAEEIGIFPKEGVFDTIPTATSSVPGSPVIIEHLTIGKSQFNSVPCILLEEKYLHKKIFSLFTEFKIDGIIGWRILKELDILIDYTEARIVIRKPQNGVHSKNNLLFFERPYVRVHDSVGRPLLMFIDTGAEFSTFSPELISKYPGLDL